MNVDNLISKASTESIKGNRQSSQDSNLISNQLYEREIYSFKIILVGDIAVGKTALLSRFITDTFSNEYKCNIGVEFKVKTVFLDETKGAELHIWDTCGEERFRSVTRQYFSNANGIIVLFDLTNRITFHNVDSWLNDIRNYTENIEVVVIGNKCDLTSKRQVYDNEINDYIQKKQLKYYESSAKDGTNIEIIFEYLTQKLCEKAKEILSKEAKASEKEKEKKMKNKQLLGNNNENTAKADPKKKESCC